MGKNDFPAKKIIIVNRAYLRKAGHACSMTKKDILTHFGQFKDEAP